MSDHVGCRAAPDGVRRPRILVLAPYYLPGCKAGGPIRSISNMVATLHDSFDFWIFTSDRDYGDVEPYSGVCRNAWIDMGDHKRFYADAQHVRLAAVAAMVRQVSPDVMYANSLFDWRFSISPLLLRRWGMIPRSTAWVMAPRGECSRGAISLKRTKKRAFLSVARLAGIHRGLTWQASSPHETVDIQREVGVDPEHIVVAPNLTEPVEEKVVPRLDATSDRLRVCFLSRITPKKNLVFAIEALTMVRTPVDFHIYGPPEDEAYTAACKEIVNRCPPHVKVTWHGHVAHEDVREALGRHDLFFFPTLGENFGHVIIESLAAGVPVLVSDQTPWRDLEQRGAGWVRSLENPQEFVDVIEAFSTSTQTERLQFSQRAHEYARSVADSSAHAAANKALFLQALQTARKVASA